MSYREKGAWVYLVVTIGSFAVYVAVILRRADGAPLAGVAYVRPMLWTIGIAVVSSMIARMVVEMATPGDRHRSDARDKEINRFGDYVGGIVLAAGLSVALGLAMARAEYFWIANAIYAALVVWAVVSTAVKLVAYRRGL